jgi:chemotaxis protein histidine kinase CheA
MNSETVETPVFNRKKDLEEYLEKLLDETQDVPKSYLAEMVPFEIDASIKLAYACLGFRVSWERAEAAHEPHSKWVEAIAKRFPKIKPDVIQLYVFIGQQLDFDPEFLMDVKADFKGRPTDVPMRTQLDKLGIYSTEELRAWGRNQETLEAQKKRQSKEAQAKEDAEAKAKALAEARAKAAEQQRRADEARAKEQEAKQARERADAIIEEAAEAKLNAVAAEKAAKRKAKDKETQEAAQKAKAEAEAATNRVRAAELEASRIAREAQEAEARAKASPEYPQRDLDEITLDRLIHASNVVRNLDKGFDEIKTPIGLLDQNKVAVLEQNLKGAAAIHEKLIKAKQP